MFIAYTYTYYTQKRPTIQLNNAYRLMWSKLKFLYALKIIMQHKLQNGKIIVPNRQI